MSDFLDRKVRTLFKHLDVNDDGFISLKDFMEIGERHCDAQKASDDEREKSRESFIKVWRDWMKSSGSDDSGLLTPSIFAESVKRHRNDPGFKESCLEMCNQFYRIMDLNGDGFLQEDEYASAIAQTGVKDTSLVHRAFDVIDLNKDGKLSYEEFSTALTEYFTSDDENCPYRELWGPLVP